MPIPKKPIHDVISDKYWASVTDCAIDVRLSGQHIRYIIKNKDGRYTDRDGTEYKLEYTDHVPENATMPTHPIMDYPDEINKSWNAIKKKEKNIYYTNIQELAYKMAANLAGMGVIGCSYVDVDDDFYYGEDDCYD